MLSQGLLLVVLLSQPASLPKLVGTLSVAEGKVRLERTGRDPQWAGRYVRLRVGDKITVVEKPKATLRMDLSRETFRLPEKGAWQVEERSLKVLEGAALVLLHREKPIRQTPGAKPPTMAGRIRGDDSSVKPVGAIVSGPITVTWNPAAGVTKTVWLLFGPLTSYETAPSTSANSVWSRPTPTFLPAWNLVPRWRTMMLPALTTWPPNTLTPSIFGCESRPLRVEPPPFFCAMVQCSFNR